MYVYIHIYRDGWKDLREERQQNGRAVIEEERKNIMMKKTGFDFFFFLIWSQMKFIFVFLSLFISLRHYHGHLCFFFLSNTQSL